jgi:hypothetical protein
LITTLYLPFSETSRRHRVEPAPRFGLVVGRGDRVAGNAGRAQAVRDAAGQARVQAHEADDRVRMTRDRVRGDRVGDRVHLVLAARVDRGRDEVAVRNMGRGVGAVLRIVDEDQVQAEGLRHAERLF